MKTTTEEVFINHIQAIDVLSYMHYKGLIYIGLGDHDKAKIEFKQVLSLPSRICHKVHVDSYKKLALLSLLDEGKLPSINTRQNSQLDSIVVAINMKMFNSLA
jgi:hypothetical protein